MYAGRVAERGTAPQIFYRPKHEYTKGLIRSIPNIENDDKEPLVPISGTPVDMLNMPAGCAFAPRCERAMKICLTEKPKEIFINDAHISACWMNVKEGAEKGIIETDENGEIVRIPLDGEVSYNG
jgi:oligopeptide transport system ATP-binding protein